jgi:hypothetical protein
LILQKYSLSLVQSSHSIRKSYYRQWKFTSWNNDHSEGSAVVGNTDRNDCFWFASCHPQLFFSDNPPLHLLTNSQETNHILVLEFKFHDKTRQRSLYSAGRSTVCTKILLRSYRTVASFGQWIPRSLTPGSEALFVSHGKINLHYQNTSPCSPDCQHNGHESLAPPLKL